MADTKNVIMNLPAGGQGVRRRFSRGKDIFLLVAAPLWLLFFMTSANYYHPPTARLKRRVENVVSLKRLRDWAVSELARHEDGRIRESELPPDIAELVERLQWVELRIEPAHGEVPRHVAFYIGGGFWHGFIGIGPSADECWAGGEDKWADGIICYTD